jgi:hypothetical protein
MNKLGGKAPWIGQLEKEGKMPLSWKNIKCLISSCYSLNKKRCEMAMDITIG